MAGATIFAAGTIRQGWVNVFSAATECPEALLPWTYQSV